MDEQKAREILGDNAVNGEYINSCSGKWGVPETLDVDFLSLQRGKDIVAIEGRFTADELEAIAWVMRNEE